VDAARPKGRRITALARMTPGGGSAPILPGDALRLVVNSFLAGGGDGMDTLRGIDARTDTGIAGSDAFAAYLARLGASGPVAPPAGPRVSLAR
jgi:2',3'-cyclic-nucleotide 2'-phosphodiesterase (5'-nucleotidase family)